MVESTDTEVPISNDAVMYLYHWDRETGWYVGWTEARLNELESLIQKRPVYLHPRYSTETPPGEFKLGEEIPVYNEKKDAWDIYECHYGATIYNKETAQPSVLTSLGPIPEGFTLDPPCENPVWNMEAEKWADIRSTLDGKIKELAAKRFEMETAGVSINGMYVKTDRESQALMTGARLKAITSTTPDKILIKWKGANGWFPLNAALVTLVSDAVYDYVEECFKSEEQHEIAIREIGNDPEALLKYDLSTGWPSRLITIAIPGTGAGKEN